MGDFTLTGASVSFQAQQLGCQVLRAVSQAIVGMQEAASDQLQACHLSLSRIAKAFASAVL